MKLARDVSLQDNNTTKIDCVARYFIEAKNREDVINGVKHANSSDLEFLVLGGGSNIILPKIYNGLVIFIANKEYKIEEREGSIILNAQAGSFLPDVSKDISTASGSGFEWAGGVPGTIGGAVRGNAGAFGDFMADYLKTIEVLDIKDLKIELFKKEECYFDYRESIFKKEKRYIVLNVEMEFPKKEGVLEKYKEYLEYRKKNHPTEPSSGSVFKNPKVPEDFFEKHKDTVKFKELGFVPVRHLINECSLSGKVEGGAKISAKHPNFIINIGGATAADIRKLIMIIKDSINQKYGIVVEPEVELINEI